MCMFLTKHLCHVKVLTNFKILILKISVYPSLVLTFAKYYILKRLI